MPLNKLDNFIKNTEGRILYVSPSDLDATDSITNSGNSLARPFKTLQRALIESARFSYQTGIANDLIERTTILLMPGDHTVDNRPGLSIKSVGSSSYQLIDSNGAVKDSDTLSLDLNTNFDLSDPDNVLYKFNSVEGGVIVPRGTSIVGLDLRKTKVRPLYVPNPTDENISPSAIFRITGTCYFWQFSCFDGRGEVYTDPTDLTGSNKANATFSHHKLTIFEYADGVNVTSTGLTDLQMYYGKLSNAYNESSTREIDVTDRFPTNPQGFEPKRPEFEIVGAFAADPLEIALIQAGDGVDLSNVVTVQTRKAHKLATDTPIKISGVFPQAYNISTLVATVVDPTTFTYLLPSFDANLQTPGTSTNGSVIVETDTVSGASPYVFNISMRSVYGLNGMKADGNKATGFRSMVVAQFTGVSLQKDDRAFVKYNQVNRSYDGISFTKTDGGQLATKSSSTNPSTIYHLDPKAIYRKGWENCHITITNDAIMQVVSVFAIGYNKHFAAVNGGDASITNSNSNFGQLALVSEGFKKEAFEKDDKAFITNIITPRAITSVKDKIDWVTLDVGLTTAVGINTHLYLFGFDSKDIKPAAITQGFRVGAKESDVLSVVIGTAKTSGILMTDASSSSFKKLSASSPVDNIFTVGTHTLLNGEKVLFQSGTGDLPENIENNVVYFAITSEANSVRSSGSLTSSQIQVASTAADAAVGVPLDVYGGDQISILSRVSDKNVGDLGHPIQFDSSNNNWFVVANAGNNIYSTMVNLGVAGIGARTEPTFIERINDARKIDDRIYKLRVVIPKETKRSKNVENGFIIQESSTTGFGTDADFTKSSTSQLTKQDYEYNRNPRFISHASYSEPNVTIRSELPHNLKVGDSIIIKNITDTTNPNIDTVGAGSSGYNGTHSVTSIVNDMEFKYNPGRNPAATVTNNFNTKNVNLPRFERNNLQSNIYAYRNEKISDYKEDVQDGIFHIYPLNSGNSVPVEFTDSKFGQNVTDLYPQLDRDNPNDNPEASKTFANRFPLGQVTTNDLKKSITRETVDKLITDVGIGVSIASAGSLSSGTRTITFTREHGIKGATNGTINPGGSGYTNGTFNNVRLFNESGLSSWNGVTANVTVSGGAVTAVDIVSKGSGISTGHLYFDTSIIGSGDGAAKFTVSTNNLSPSTENYVQISGMSTAVGGYFPIASVPSKNSITIAQASEDPDIFPFQYAFVAGHSVAIGTAILPSSTTGITTIQSSNAHGLAAGNRVQIVSSTGASPYYNYGEYTVKSISSVGSFSVVGQVKDPKSGTLLSAGTPNAIVLKHNLSANDESSDAADENLGVRGSHLFDDEILYINSFTTSNKIKVQMPGTGIGTMSRFPYGSYIQVDDEIMRISDANMTANGEITVLRGALGTRVEGHDNGSLIRKIKPIAIELRRPSVLRASGHTFEYLGYGPGNYSTALPQLQTVSLSEKEEFLSQALEKSSGAVVYTGMNDKGDFYIGNQKKSSLTGEETTFDTPVPTVTGEDPSRLSVVFDEVTVKERLVVEGGASSQILSQFDGPVTFNEETRIKDKLVVEGTLKIENDTAASSPTDASFVLSGGFGVAKQSIFADNAKLIFGTDSDASIEYDETTTDQLNIAGAVTRFTNTTQSTSKDTGGVILEGGLGVEKNVSIGGTLDVDAHTELDNLNVSGVSTFAGLVDINAGGQANTFKVEDLTANRVVTVGTGGELQDSANLTFDGTTLTGTFSGNLTGTASFAENSNTIDVKSESDSSTYHNIVFTRTALDSTEGEEVDAFLRADHEAGLQFKPSNRELRVDGDIIAFHSSDERLKKNIKKIDDPLAKVLSIGGYTFDWTEESEKEDSGTGVIAQEIEKLGLPGLVTTRKKSGYKAVDYEKLVPLLIEAIKELNGKVNDLQQQINN